MKKIPLTQNKYTLVDDEDYEKFSSTNWHFDGLYAAGYIFDTMSTPKKKWRLHRLIIAHIYASAGEDIPNSKQVDHINGDKLDNRRANLRICTLQQNRANRELQKNNTSGFKGVTWFPQTKRWSSKIKKNNKYVHIGYFKDKIEAAKAYNEAAKIYYGEFARLNQI